MFLSRIELNPMIYDTRRAISVPQVLHATIEGCFTNKTDKDRKLWRLDRLNGILYLLLLSPEKPDFSLLSRQLCSKGIIGETKDYSPLLASIQTGVKFRFRLRANPTHSIPSGKGTRGKVYPHITIEQKREWLKQKAKKSGFILDDLLFDIVETDYLRFWRDSKARPVELGVAVFEGELKVSDREIFVQALTQGIGRAKAYGCGLLTVAGLQ